MIIDKNNIEEKLGEALEEINNLVNTDGVAYVEFLSKQQYKSSKQNKTFYALLDCFWKSGCSSFASREEMRFYYKKSVGLIDVLFDNSNINEDTKNMVWQALKVLPIETTQKLEVINLLKGKVVKERSWGQATKKQATEAINAILQDMDMAGVSGSDEGKHYEEILEGMNADNWWNGK